MCGNISYDLTIRVVWNQTSESESKTLVHVVPM